MNIQHLHDVWNIKSKYIFDFLTSNGYAIESIDSNFNILFIYKDVKMDKVNNNIIIKLMKIIDNKNYNPESSTPLFDAMGFSILKLKNFLSDKNNRHGGW